MSKISVSALVRYLKNKLDSDGNLQGVTVSGELSNFHRHGSGHLYFTLKDERAAIACVMFSSKASTLRFNPKNGDKVVLTANTSLFEVSGQLQLYVNSMKLDGLGDLYQQYEELKNKLNAEGYFSSENKINIKTKYPEKVAVLVGDNSAAMSDIKTQFNRRWPICEVDYYPTLVQGVDAPKDIIKNLIKVDALEYDAIILARGGGSFEDLFCFNSEELVKTIFGLKTFIVSGVGHEQDFTLTDFVCDLRAPTPTASVELITPNIKDVIKDVNDLSKTANISMKDKLDYIKEKLDILCNNKYLLNPSLLIDNASLKIDFYNQRLLNFNNKVKNLELEINNCVNLIKLKTDSKLYRRRNDLKSYRDLLNAYSFDKTLKRGFSIIYKDNHIVNDIDDLNINDEINIKLHNGKLITQVKEKVHG